MRLLVFLQKKMGCENPEFVECPSFNEVHEAVDRGRCEFGVMPIENSLGRRGYRHARHLGFQGWREHHGFNRTQHPPLPYGEPGILPR